MKSSFPGYYRPSAEGFAELWKSALFAFDANVLLNIYGYSVATRNTLLELLGAVEDRLWIPHQFAHEYQRNRAKAILEQVAHYRTVQEKLREILDGHFKAAHKHPFVGKKSLSAFERLCDELKKGESDHLKLLAEDPYFDRMTKLFEGRVGAAPDEEQLAVMQEDARRRYSKEIPPGYMDQKKKSEPDVFGDYVGWRELLDRGKELGTSVILVTDEQKEDWWQLQSERRIGPRPELVAEYLKECGKPFYMYSLAQFMRRAKEYLGQQVKAAAIEEVRERSKAKLEADGDPKSSGRREMEVKATSPDEDQAKSDARDDGGDVVDTGKKPA